MTLIHRFTPQKNIHRSFPVFTLLVVLAVVTGGILFLSTPALAATGTTTTLAVSPASVTAGSVVTMTAAVTSGGTPLTAGQVVCCNASAPYYEDSAVLGTVWVTATPMVTWAIPAAITYGTP